MIPEEERKLLREKGQFLIERGLTKEEDEYSIDYYNKDYIISICYEPYSLYSRAIIRFRKRNEVFDIGWIMKVRTKEEPAVDKLENALDLLEYIKENYDSLIQYDFCKECDKLIDQYLIEHKEEIYKNNEKFFKSLENFDFEEFFDTLISHDDGDVNSAAKTKETHRKPKDSARRKQQEVKGAGRILDKICFWKKEK